MFNNLTPNDAEDIFADTDKPAAASAQPQIPVQPQFQAQAPVQTSASSQYADPRLQPYNPAVRQAAAAPALDAASESDGGHSRAAKMLKGLLIMIVALGALGAAAYFAYTQLGGKLNKSAQLTDQKAAEQSPATTTDQASQPIVVDDNQSPVVIPPISTISDQTASSTDVIPGLGQDTASSSLSTMPDADADGLSDKDEIAIGTNPSLSDTDGDGLSDFEEVSTYKSNPLLPDSDADGLNDYEEVKQYNTNPGNADSDGDTYLDGAEVKGGFNPNGPGKL